MATSNDDQIFHSRSEAVNSCAKFFREFYETRLQDIICSPNPYVYHSLYFWYISSHPFQIASSPTPPLPTKTKTKKPQSFVDLLDYNHELAYTLLNEPDKALGWLDEGLLEAQKTIMEETEYNKQPEIKRKCKARLEPDLPYPSTLRETIASIRSADVGSIIQISGTGYLSLACPPPAKKEKRDEKSQPKNK